MKVYVFGNADVAGDSGAIEVAKELKPKVRNIEFVEVKPNEDLPIKDGEDVVVMDVMEGIDKVMMLELTDEGKIGMSNISGACHFVIKHQKSKINVKDEKLNTQINNRKEVSDRGRRLDNESVRDERELTLPPRSTVHDWDLGWQLAYLKKLGKVGRVWVVGIPKGGKVTAEEIERILEGL